MDAVCADDWTHEARPRVYGEPMSSWRGSPVVAAVACALFLVVQLAIPISRIDETDRGTRFGWHMFSGAQGTPEFVVETAEGEKNIALEDYMARVRVDVDIRGQLPSHVCDVVPGALVVSWDQGEHLC
jgi:hypothetical protein